MMISASAFGAQGILSKGTFFVFCRQVEREPIVLSAIAREIQFRALPGSGQSREISEPIHQARYE